MLTDHLLISVLNIVLIDIILGGDNAVVIALACRRLPVRQRNKAILLGTGLAVILRIVLTAMMVSLLQVPYLLLIGGLMLIYIAFKLLINKEEDVNIKAGTSLLSAVRTIVFADLVMGLDNVLGIAGAAKGNILLVILGLSVSVPIIIWGSKIILNAMEHVPGLIYIGGAVLAYTASGMIMSEPKIHSFFLGHPEMKTTFTVIIIVGVLLSGLLINNIKSNNASQHF
ncbi:YjbE family integral membrane protein [Scopulibacillus darangshiensis]|uniref:YjbE family integral membrane protein n=1 Tax=Scopulibacillus darangshiensis TaxID=442528 RepID=A0A4R2P4Q4_9BACL|nr:TerC family protein [Scopulibacillus darangshiensis]TCP29742.1 YjbE family integral membrane protein [Scopulibacillus darangshiensis]